MSKHPYLVGNSEQLRPAFDAARAGLAEGNAIALEWKAVSNRSLSQNALFHVWCREMAESFTKRDKKGTAYSEADMKDLMKHQFLGYEGKTVGKTEIAPQLISTKKLSKGAMFQFMEQVLAWSFQVGVMLSQPEDSEFMKLKESQHDT